MAGKKTRQKMINMMYLVLTAMLALNVSTDVLNGFELMEESLGRTIKATRVQNNSLFEEMAFYAEKNPQKAGLAFDSATAYKREADSLFVYLQELKVRIAEEAGGTLEDLKRKDDTEVASRVMFRVIGGEGERLRKRINAFREYSIGLIADTTKRRVIAENLSTKASGEFALSSSGWENMLFNNMPTVSAIATLSKLQSDIVSAEGDVLSAMVKEIDGGDFRVNSIRAHVIPNSNTIIRGGKYSAKIVLSAEDSTKRPDIFLNERRLPASQNGVFETSPNSTGEFNFKGYVEMEGGDGARRRFPFSQSYSVVEPSATVSATMMNLLYAGFDNPVSISVPGVTNGKVTASMSNGTLSRAKDGSWIARPSKVGEDAVITISAEIDGRMQRVSSSTFRVRSLPLPAPYIPINSDRYLGGTKIDRGQLLAATGIGAGIFDGMLNISFTVLSFDIRISNGGMTQYESSNGANFSTRQVDLMKRMVRGSSFNISNIKVKGPDGITRQLPSPIEVLL
ncbi:MAG: gliding motility protein GldM [Bacteroidales bacterium]